MRHLFWDGRVAVDAQAAFYTPAGAQLTPGDDAGVRVRADLGARRCFPSPIAPRCAAGTGNELARDPRRRPQGIWPALMRRLGAIPRVSRHVRGGVSGHALRGHDVRPRVERHRADSSSTSSRSRNSPWDRFLAGNDDALTMRQLEGAQTFLTLKCSICHNGATFSDEQFHNVAVAQIGPGEGNGVGVRDDFGRMNVTGIADGPLSLPHHAAAQRGAHRSVRPRRRDRRPARVRRALQRVGPQAARVRSDAARAGAARSRC